MPSVQSVTLSVFIEFDFDTDTYWRLSAQLLGQFKFHVPSEVRIRGEAAVVPERFNVVIVWVVPFLKLIILPPRLLAVRVSIVLSPSKFTGAVPVSNSSFWILLFPFTSTFPLRERLLKIVFPFNSAVLLPVVFIAVSSTVPLEWVNPPDKSTSALNFVVPDDATREPVPEYEPLNIAFPAQVNVPLFTILISIVLSAGIEYDSLLERIRLPEPVILSLKSQPVVMAILEDAPTETVAVSLNVSVWTCNVLELLTVNVEAPFIVIESKVTLFSEITG